MRYSVSNSVRGPRAKSKFFRTFYITIFLISAYAAFSIVADRSARYFQGHRYGVAERRALAELDITRLLKRDEEVCGDSRHSID
jgi:sodium/potassium/calcium exchanger 6